MAVSDSFIVSTFAAWAGDAARFRQLISEIAPRGARGRLDEGRAENALELMSEVAGLRLRVHERRLTDDIGLDAPVSESWRADPDVLTSRHLRGVIWRVDEREFLLQAYLNDLGWETELFSRARERRGEVVDRPVAIEPAESEERRDVGRTYGPIGVSWVVPGNPFLRVELSDLGLLRARGLWTASVLEEGDGRQIRKAFQDLLDGLDE